MNAYNGKTLALIIEDNVMLSNMFSRALRDIDYETLIIDNGTQAINWLSANAPDVLLLDLHLPYASGQEILDRFEANPRLQGTYFVIVTADARMGEMLQDKVDFLLNKPVDILQLQQLAERLKNGKKGRISLSP
jgi:CheY-like chemotaxis protein